MNDCILFFPQNPCLRHRLDSIQKMRQLSGIFILFLQLVMSVLFTLHCLEAEWLLIFFKQTNNKPDITRSMYLKSLRHSINYCYNALQNDSWNNMSVLSHSQREQEYLFLALHQSENPAPSLFQSPCQAPDFWSLPGHKILILSHI